jgi:DnaJ domain
VTPKKIKAETREELLAVGIAKFARKLGLRVTDEQAVTYVRNKHTPPGAVPAAAPAPAAEPQSRPKPQLTPEMERLIAEMIRMYFQRQGYNAYNPYSGNPYSPPPAAVAKREIPWRVILGFPQNKPVTAEEVQSRYKKLSTVYHPDAGGSEESFRAITEARDVALRDPAVRHGAQP